MIVQDLGTPAALTAELTDIAATIEIPLLNRAGGEATASLLGVALGCRRCVSYPRFQ